MIPETNDPIPAKPPNPPVNALANPFPEVACFNKPVHWLPEELDFNAELGAWPKLIGRSDDLVVSDAAFIPLWAVEGNLPVELVDLDSPLDPATKFVVPNSFEMF